MELHLTLNGEPVSKIIAPDASLLNFLRECGCHSVRSGCDTGNCGICTVWVDGQPLLSCAYPAARAEGKNITTLEGVKAEADELIRYMAEEGADQCGYCSPGFIMAVLGMKRELQNPTEEEGKHYLAGNLCRCTGYASQTRILQKYLAEVQNNG